MCFFSHLASPITPSALALQRRVTVGLSSFPSSLPSPPQTSPLIIGGHWSRQSNKDPVCETAASQRVCDTRVTQRRWDREEGARETGGGGGRRESYKTPKITTIQQKWVLNHALNVKAKCKKKGWKSQGSKYDLKQNHTPSQCAIKNVHPAHCPSTGWIRWVATSACMSLVYRHMTQT